MHCSVLTDMIMFVRWRIPSENKLYVHKKLVNILYVRTHVRMFFLPCDLVNDLYNSNKGSLIDHPIVILDL